MSRQLADLEQVLKLLIAEHEKLLQLVQLHQAAMKKLDLKKMEDLANQQEAIRMRVTALDARRRTLVSQLAAGFRLEGQCSISRLAEAIPPPARFSLLKLRDRLRDLMGGISTNAQIGSRVAGAVLGHLNTAVRYLAGAVEQAGLYTKNGTAQISHRIGMIEAVG